MGQAKNIGALQSGDSGETTVMLFLYQSQFSVGEERYHHFGMWYSNLQE